MALLQQRFRYPVKSVFGNNSHINIGLSIFVTFQRILIFCMF